MRRHLLVLAAASTGVAVLVALGGGELALPPRWSPAGLATWVDERGASIAAFALLRVATLGAGAYVILVTALGVAADVLGGRRLRRGVDLVTLPALRAVLGGAGVTTLVLVSSVGAPWAGAEPAPAPRDRLVEIAVDPPPTTDPTPTQPTPSTVGERPLAPPRPSAPTTSDDSPPPTMRVLAPAAAEPDPTRTIDAVPSQPSAPVPPDRTEPTTAPAVEVPPAPTAAPAPAITMRLLPRAPAPSPTSTPVPAPSPAAATDTTWTVEPGESFWSVAHAHLADVAGRAPTDREVDAYWRRLVAGNRAAAPTGDPDLIYAGTVLVLPPVEQA